MRRGWFRSRHRDLVRNAQCRFDMARGALHTCDAFESADITVDIDEQFIGQHRRGRPWSDRPIESWQYVFPQCLGSMPEPFVPAHLLLPAQVPFVRDKQVSFVGQRSIGVRETTIRRENPIGMQGNIALRYGQLVAKLWGSVRGPLAPFELRVSVPSIRSVI